MDWHWPTRLATQATTPTRKVGWLPEETVVGAVAAHPDDVEAAAGGTLAMCAERRIPFHVLIVSGGEAGAAGHPKRVARVRLGEARAGAATLGATSFHTLGWHDAYVHNSIKLQVQIVAWARRHGVNLLMTHWAEDYHADHREVSDAVRDSRLKADLPNFGTGRALAGAPDLVHWDAQYGYRIRPDLLLDVTSTMAVRQRAIDCHHSQATLPDGRRLRDVTDAQAIVRGQQNLCLFAEAFQGAAGPPRHDAGIRRLVHLLDH
jgi:N-acetylglucosamine malate deacetylase 1